MLITTPIIEAEKETFNNDLLIIDDKKALELFKQLFDNRFYLKYTKELTANFDDITFYADKHTGVTIKGMAQFAPPKEMKVNIGEFAEKEDPLKAISNLKEIYAISIKALLRKKLHKNHRVSNPLIVKAAAKLFLKQFKSYIKKYGNFSVDLIEDEIKFDTVIVANFVSIIVKRNSSFASVTAKQIVTDLYKYDKTLEKDPVVYSTEALQEAVIFSNWSDFFVYLNEYVVQNRITTNSLVSYYLMSYPMTATGLDFYEHFLSDTYALLATNAYNAKFIYKIMFNEATDFVKTFEQII